MTPMRDAVAAFHYDKEGFLSHARKWKNMMLICMTLCLVPVLNADVKFAVGRPAGQKRKLDVSSAIELSEESNANGEEPRFNSYNVCDLSKPHEVLGLPELSSESPPSVQAIWVAYYSRVIVAEHQAEQFSLYRLYCAAMAAKKMLYEKDPAKYFRFFPQGEDTYLGNVGDPDGKLADSVQSELEESVQQGNEVEAMMLYPDIFDVGVIKALMTLGWQEIKFYDADHTVWMEWFEDEHEERESWVRQMKSEVLKVEKEREKLMEEGIRAQLQAGRPVPETVKTKSYAEELMDEVNRTVRGSATMFRRLDQRAEYNTQVDVLNLKIEELESAVEEMEKVNLRWETQRQHVLSRWYKFVHGASEREDRNKISGGESWEQALEWVTEKYSEDSAGSRDYCEGYILEAVLEVNKVGRVDGDSWRIQRLKNKAFVQLSGEDPARAEEAVENVVLLDSHMADEDSPFLGGDAAYSEFEAALDAEVDILIEELLKESGGLDDFEELAKELQDANEAEIWEQILQNAESIESAAAASEAMFADIDDILGDMTQIGALEYDLEDVENLQLDELVGAMMGENYDESSLVELQQELDRIANSDVASMSKNNEESASSQKPKSGLRRESDVDEGRDNGVASVM